MPDNERKKKKSLLLLPRMRKSARIASKAVAEAVFKNSRRSAVKRARDGARVHAKFAHSAPHVKQDGGSYPSDLAAKRFKTERSSSVTTSELSLKLEEEDITEIASPEMRPVTKVSKRSKKPSKTKKSGARAHDAASRQTGKNLDFEKNSSFPKRVKGKERVRKSDIQSKSAMESMVSNVTLGGLGESKMLVGAHVSISGGLYKAVHEARGIGARSFAMFLKSQRQWESKPLDEKAAACFREACESMGYKANAILPHGSYLMNCGSPSDETLAKSRGALFDELQRCEKLGLTMYNFHPGSTCGKITVDECLDRIAESINLAHSKTKFVTTVVENMSCQGNTIGGKFVELQGIIDRVHDKSRIGVCLDTCHAFAAGHDLATEQGFKKMMEEFESVVGIKYLKAVHLNDSKGELGCHLDRHENIGEGKIGLDGFRLVMQDPRFCGIPMILETPSVDEDIYAKEIELLNSFIK